jgi:hypothetical protein
MYINGGSRMATGFYVPSADELAASSTGDWGTLPEDEYKVRIAELVEVNRPSQYNPVDPETGLAPSTYDVKLKPLSIADDEELELVDTDGEVLNDDKYLVFFFDPRKIGTRPVIAKSRKFLASALGVPADGPINLPGGLNDLIGKELIATVVVKNGNNRITDTRPAKKQRARVRTAKEADVTAEAKEIFPDAAKDESAW